MTNRIALSVGGDDEDVAYLLLPDHPGAGVPHAVARQIRLLDVLKYDGPDINLDFDARGRLIGIEILA
jgi:uncharacterized protein YuzE